MEVTIQVNGLDCSGARYLMSDRLYAIDSVKRVVCNLRASTLKITYKNKKDLSLIEQVVGEVKRKQHSKCENPNPCANCKKAAV